MKVDSQYSIPPAMRENYCFFSNSLSPPKMRPITLLDFLGTEDSICLTLAFYFLLFICKLATFKWGSNKEAALETVHQVLAHSLPLSYKSHYDAFADKRFWQRTSTSRYSLSKGMDSSIP